MVQDAALQAGHFNDFMQVTTLRSGIYKAVKQAADQKLSYEKLGQAIFDALEMGSDDRFLDFAHANEVPSFPSAKNLMKKRYKSSSFTEPFMT